MNSTKKVNVLIDNTLVGSIAMTSDWLCAFQYSDEWLETGFSISPFALPLKSDLFLAKKNPFNGNFGVFDDSLPDGWGLLIMDRYLKSININPNDVSILDMLTYVGSYGRGALSFQPDNSSYSVNNADILSIESDIKKILSADSYQGDSIEKLWKRGGSPGGARPKVFITLDDSEWMVKFPALYDSPNIGIVEYNYSLLAKKCGINMPETKLFENRFFGVKRFDRTENGERIHSITAAGLLGADYRIPSLDYIQLMKLTRLLTTNEDEVWRMFRLMCFNYLINNKDDHAKNFTFLYYDNHWHLSPAYDLLPSSGINGYHTTSFDGDIIPSDKSIFRIAVKSGLEEKKARKVFSNIKEIINESNINNISE